MILGDYCVEYVARNAEDKTTPLVASITQGSGANAMSYTYEYDERGNITSVAHNGKITSYKYDAVGQLTRVNDQTDTTSGVNGTTWVYVYSNHGGNFSSKRRYPYTPDGTSLPSTYDERIIYSYGDSKWKDKLTKYKGVAITYDGIGNPLDDGTWTYTWQAERQLAGMSKTGMTVSYAYDHNGLRTQKTVTTGGITTTTNYQLHGKLVTELTRGTDKLHFFYDAQSRPAMVEYNGVMYTYVHNLQGDIVGILNGSGAVVVEYRYDAWGRPTGVTGSMAGTLGEVNPFRYRGYVYDEETGLYYLRSRYYNPVWQRFVNADSILQNNRSVSLYTYCGNRPTSRRDLDGFAAKSVNKVSTQLSNTISISDSFLFYKGNKYPLNEPRISDGPCFTVAPKVVARGSYTTKIKYRDAILFEFAGLDMSVYPPLAALKNQYGTAQISVLILQKQDQQPYASVSVRVTKNSINKVDNGVLYNNVQLDTGEMHLNAFSNGRGYFHNYYTGKDIVLDDDFFCDGWFSELIDNVSLTEQ